jgi:RNA polymerase sigma-70 factor (ECF subfamily)
MLLLMKDFQRLAEAEIPTLQRYARSLHRWNTSDTSANDLVQDTLVRAVAEQHLWNQGTSLRAWLYKRMHRRCLQSWVTRNLTYRIST